MSIFRRRELDRRTVEGVPVPGFSQGQAEGECRYVVITARKREGKQ